jgi:hypothetical protein
VFFVCWPGVPDRAFFRPDRRETLSTVAPVAPSPALRTSRYLTAAEQWIETEAAGLVLEICQIGFVLSGIADFGHHGLDIKTSP